MRESRLPGPPPVPFRENNYIKPELPLILHLCCFVESTFAKRLRHRYSFSSRCRVSTKRAVYSTIVSIQFISFNASSSLYIPFP
jgi:hypothetical protein